MTEGQYVSHCYGRDTIKHQLRDVHYQFALA